MTYAANRRDRPCARRALLSIGVVVGLAAALAAPALALDARGIALLAKILALPEAGCELCRDHGFGTDGAVRLWGETSPVAMYARAWPCMALDLDSFSELRLRLFGHEGVSARLELLVRKNDMDVRTVTIPGQKREEFGEDWAELAFPLALEQCRIEKMRLVFDVDRPVKAVTVENLRAVPR